MIFIEMLQVSIDGIMKRGKAVKGEKTMLDAMIQHMMQSSFL